MQAASVRTAADARKIVAARAAEHVKVGVFDIDGVLRGKYMQRDKFTAALDGGFGFCNVVLGWDVADATYDNAAFTGWHTGFPDAAVRLLPETCRDIPFEDGTLLFLGEFAGAAEAVCPRATLRRVLDRADAMDFHVEAAFEYEFFVFEETSHSVREKRYAGLKPMAPGSFGYSMLRSSTAAPFYHALLDTAAAMRFPVEALHEEVGAGVLEAALAHTGGLEAADRAALFKTFAKVVAQRHGLMATFMARCSAEWPGQSGHIHVSLVRKRGGANAFHDPRKPDGMADAMRHALAGQQALMPELLALVAPTVNSYRRLIPGAWAPTEASWGVENRTCALRAIRGGDTAQRIEYRVADADANPYLALAAAVASALHGIAEKLEPTAPIAGNAYTAKHPKRLALPRTLMDAAAALRRSAAARAAFGDAFVDHFAASREWEERAFRHHVTDWEMDRYFEII